MKYVLSAFAASAVCVGGAVLILMWLLHSVSDSSSPYAWTATLLKIAIGIAVVYGAASVVVIVVGVIAALFFLEKDRG